MGTVAILADVVPPTTWVVERLVLPFVAVLALVGIAVLLVRRRRRKTRAQRPRDA